MSALIACGINHKTAPISVRERLVFDQTSTATSLHELIGHGIANEAAILSTCNRTEIYCHSRDQDSLIDWISSQQTFDHAPIKPHLYCHRDQEAIKHMLRVANGLDSMVLGEVQILGQMKKAFSLARHAGTLGPHLQNLFQYIFSASKHIRSSTNIGNNPLSVAYLAVNLAKRIFADLSEKNALLIGAGDTIERAAKQLHEQNIKQLFIANRTPSHATKITAQFGGEILKLTEIPHYLAQADIVIAATQSSLPILGKGMVETAIKARKHKPMLMLDIAVPRDIEKEVGQLDDIYLYSIDDLQQIINENIRDRKNAAEQAEHIIQLHTAEYLQRQTNLANTDLVCAYRSKALAMRDEELAKCQKALAQGQAPQDVLQNLAYRLTNKLLHEPTVTIKNTPQDSEILALARELFGIDE